MKTVNITAYSATVQWVTPYLAYTPEQYVVSYGTMRESLNQRSPVLSSITDIAASNLTYDVFIPDLSPNTEYFYQVHSTNTYTTTASVIMNFTTLEAGKFIPIIIMTSHVLES